MTEPPRSVTRIGEQLAAATRNDLGRRRARTLAVTFVVLAALTCGALVTVLPGKAGIPRAEAARVLADLRAAVAPPPAGSVTHVVTDNRGWDARGRETWHLHEERWTRGCAFRSRNLPTRITPATVVPGAEESRIGTRRQLYDPRAGAVLTTRDVRPITCIDEAAVWEAGIREELAGMRYRVAERTEVDGRPAYRLESDDMDGSLYVDAERRVPVLSRQGNGEYRTPVWEHLPPGPRVRRVFDLRAAHPGATVRSVDPDAFERIRGRLMGQP